jgi:hypothetical protein
MIGVSKQCCIISPSDAHVACMDSDFCAIDIKFKQQQQQKHAY